MNMRPRMVVHLNGKRWVFTMDSPKQYTKVLGRLERIAGVDTSALPTNLVAGQEVNVAVKLPDDVQNFVSDAALQQEMVTAFPCLERVKKCPCGCKNKTTLKSLVIHLNDGEQWTREAIADWLESLDVDLELAV